MFKVLTFFNIKIFLFLLACTILFYIPLLFNPSLLLNRDNDLQQFFWPLFQYIKQHLILDYSIPLWNNLFLSGVPLLPDPQSFIFYPPNLIFLFLPVGTAFIFSFIMHTLVGSIGTYLCAKYGFKFSTVTSLFTASLFIISPKIAGYLEAGHYGLVASSTFIPFLIVAIILLSRKQKIIYSIILAVSLAGIFYTHTIIFIIVSIATLFLFIYILFFTVARKNWLKYCLFFFATTLLAFGLIAITFLPQLEWTPETTRFLLLEDRSVYPQWISKKEIIINIIFPYLNGKEYLWNIDSEKWLSIGFTVIILSLIGFWQIRKKLQIILGLSVIFIIIIILNNSSPLYPYLLQIDWFTLIRVSTRFWIIIIFISIFLAGFGFDFLLKKRINKIFWILIVTVTLSELLFLSWSRFFIPIIPSTKYISQDFYDFIKQDQGIFRVFCINRCIPQQKAVTEGLQLVEGYNTLLQKNYYKHMWQLSGGYWNYYTLALPPIGVYTYEKLHPDPKSLGDYNTKYIISPYKLDSVNFIFEKKYGNYFLYLNKLFLSRAYFKNVNEKQDIEAPILIYQPNFIKIDTSKQLSKQIILAEVYSKGWRAYLNGIEQIPVQETPNSLRLVEINSDTKFVDFKYMPNSYKISAPVTLLTILIVIILLKR